ncbi:MAG TPA: 2-oxoglutarate dehydrogenase complex dihydrolipoyllysine-residue succinyltransferase [Pseudobdellovibrionaceae bacterium]|nr:2-oxoglutarate dehydrogenase complex dihydrolipoyllysine-residue succinyltransferase [Pseudobdellovibrionaceae bacterium]
MKVEVKVPSVGESITEATVGSWIKKNGEFVKKNEPILSLETDKASVEVISESDGVLTVMAQAGDTVKIGSVVAVIDSDAKAASLSAAPPSAAATSTAKPPPPPPHSQPTPLSPAVQRIVSEKGIDPSQISGTGKDGRITKADALGLTSSPNSIPTVSAPAPAPTPTEAAAAKPAPGSKRLVAMTTIRKRIAARLVESQQSTATLTTFNEIDMSRINELRNKYKDKFKEKYGISLGFMGLFTKATIEALKAFPQVNAYIVGNDIEFHDYFNIGMAVSTEKGLIVPSIKNAQNLTVPEIEQAIRNFALKAREGKISVDDLSGGTFTITNGGVFGSLLSTPILNPPQSGILGLHKVEDRPIALNGQVVIRPMMYVALSYDHRMIDGKEAVGFLVKVKEGIEDPERLLLEI